MCLGRVAGKLWHGGVECIVLLLGIGSSLFQVLRFSGSLVLVFGYSISLVQVIYITYTYLYIGRKKFSASHIFNLVNISLQNLFQD